jgi:hypothetical protein
MGKKTTSEVVKDTSKGIWNVLRAENLLFPTTEMYKNVAENYVNQWNFPNCIRSIDGKHVAIKCPNRSGSKFHNYKHFSSILLQAVDNCKLTKGDEPSKLCGHFRISCLYKLLETRELNDAPDSELPSTVLKVPFALLWEEGYPPLPHLKRPCSARNFDKRRVFNYQLSRVRRTVGCAFGMMCTKWRILLKCMETVEHNATSTVKLYVLYIIFFWNVRDLTEITLSSETEQIRSRGQEHRFSAVRETFLNYCNSAGCVPLQNYYALTENILQRHNTSCNFFGMYVNTM